MSFAAKYNGRCPGCGTRIRVGDECEYAGSRVVHEGCADPATALVRVTESFGLYDGQDGDREPEPVIIGRRNHQRLCGACNTIHAGECW
jgi:hypothetical protein